VLFPFKKVSIGNPDGFAENLLGRRRGESSLASLGSGFRRNDASTENSTFCEWFTLD
jgi:hypothetical protein